MQLEKKNQEISESLNSHFNNFNSQLGQISTVLDKQGVSQPDINFNIGLDKSYNLEIGRAHV